MDTRVLKYFLTVAQTNNITHAAELLHITQPTLSRQMMDLEKELQVSLFDRSQHQMQLTKEGVLFQQRATTLLALFEQTKNELHETKNELTGHINLGCVVSSVSPYMMQIINSFQQKYPNVKFNLTDGNGDLLRQRLDTGLADLTVLLEPVETAKYNYLILPPREQWGVILRADDPLAKRSFFTKDDLYKLPLIAPARSIIRDDVSDVLKLDQSKLNIMATNNLPDNTIELIRTGNYYAIAISGIVNLYNDSDLAFVPFHPHKETGHVLTWRKNTVLSPAAEKFLQFVTAQVND